MPALTGLLNLGRIAQLFKKSEDGDPLAKAELQTYKDSPEITVTAKGKEAQPMDVPVVTDLIQSLPNSGKNLSFLSGSTPRINPRAEGPQDPNSKWKTLAILADAGIRGAQDPRFRQDGPGVLAGKFRKEQSDALTRRQAMWDTAYQDSQNLPPAVLQDPKFASLAKAKMALDKDMQDGKVDNEQNVSLFLTELARFKPELDEVAALSKAEAAFNVQNKLRDRMIDTGQLMNYEGALVSPEDYARLSATRAREQAEAAESKRRWEAGQATSQQQHQETMARLGAADQRAALQDENADTRQQAQVLRNMVDASADKFMEEDPNNPGKRVLTEAGAVKAMLENADAIQEAATRAGVTIEQATSPSLDAGYTVIDGKRFDFEDPQQKLAALKYLYQRALLGPTPRRAK